MSEQAPERRTEAQGGREGAQRPGQQKKILGMSRPQAIGLGVVALGGLIYLIYRARKNAAAAAAAQTNASACPDGSTPDANGNCPQNGTDYSGALDTLQSEIADLQGALAAGGAGGGGSSGGVGTAGGTGTAGSVGAATGTTTAPPTTAPVTTGAPPSTKAPVSAGPISNLRATSTGTTSFTIAWNAATNATGGYAVVIRDLANHTQVGGTRTTKGTSMTITGLKSGTDYNAGVQGLPGGAGDNIHVRTK